MKTTQMHKDLIQLLQHHFFKDELFTSSKDIIEKEYDYRKLVNDVIHRATTEQLWSIYRITLRDDKPAIKILPCNPADHLAIQFAGCYVGIELDGYTHS